MLDRLTVTRIVAAPAALDRLTNEDGVIVIRSAVDEVLMISDGDAGPAAAVDVDDPHAIVIDDGGWVGRWLPTDEAERFLARECAWPRPTERPAQAQGMVAGLAVKLWLEADRTLFLVPHVVAVDFEERLSP